MQENHVEIKMFTVPGGGARRLLMNRSPLEAVGPLVGDPLDPFFA
jgi:hypothetical protein